MFSVCKDLKIKVSFTWNSRFILLGRVTDPLIALTAKSAKMKSEIVTIRLYQDLIKPGIYVCRAKPKENMNQLTHKF